uniref:Uncharacterized protein n=1 Tax=Setaria viridis TaxID=4556 RepID=A0A4U6VE58_SETVI|nr:hypothetical protein SEVIR_3G169800v2 [Setaria viridis]
MLQRWLLMFHLFRTRSGGPLPDPGEIRAGKDRAAAMVDNLRRQAVPDHLSQFTKPKCSTSRSPDPCDPTPRHVSPVPTPPTRNPPSDLSKSSHNASLQFEPWTTETDRWTHEIFLPDLPQQAHSSCMPASKFPSRVAQLLRRPPLRLVAGHDRMDSRAPFPNRGGSSSATLSAAPRRPRPSSHRQIPAAEPDAARLFRHPSTVAPPDPRYATIPPSPTQTAAATAPFPPCQKLRPDNLLLRTRPRDRSRMSSHLCALVSSVVSPVTSIRSTAR